LPTAVIAGKAAQISRDAGEDELLSTGRLDRARYPLIVKGIHCRTVDDVDSGESLDQLREGRAPHAVTCGGGDDDGQFVQLGSFRKADHIVFELARGNVPDTRHEADLMIDEDNRRILGGQRFVPG